MFETLPAESYPFALIGAKICIAPPKTIQIAKLGKALGYKHMESHFAYVHRTLTREVAVFEKDDET
jgi:hypothetical protein